MGERFYCGALEMLTDKSEVRVQFVDIAHRADAGMCFGDSRPVS